MTTTKAQLDNMVQIINSKMEAKGMKNRVVIRSGYGKVGLSLQPVGETYHERDLSPLMSKKELYNFIDGIWTCIQYL